MGCHYYNREMTRDLWLDLNKHLCGGLSLKEAIDIFCNAYRIPHWRVLSELAAYRHDPPLMMQ
jgi:hypothetical protein